MIMAEAAAVFIIVETTKLSALSSQLSALS